MPACGELIWGDRNAFPYDEGKRQAERTIALHYPGQNAAMVRFPFVIGPVDACSRGTVSLCDIFTWLSDKNGKSPVLDPAGDEAPYNGAPDYSLDTAKAGDAGYTFPKLDSWLYDLLDSYIRMDT